MTTKRLTTADFIFKAKSFHVDRYDYSNLVYVNRRTKVEIICPEHGSFWQTPSIHLNGAGCPQCANKSKRLRKNTILERCKNLYDVVYDYSSVPSEIKTRDSVLIRCPHHGNFKVNLNNHMRGGAPCPKCQKIRKKEKNKNIFLKKAKKLHKEFYSYEKVVYENNRLKVQIICPKHGHFWQTPDSHLSGCGCPKCGYAKNSLNLRYSKNQFIENAFSVHGDKYDYSKVIYEKKSSKVEIVCPEHGSFFMRPENHIHLSQECPLCNKGPVSFLEKEIVSFINTLDISYQTNVRDLINPQELDIVIPSKKIAIEFNGLWWHCEKNKPNKNYHLDKTIACEKAGYRLIHIYEDEWRDKQERVKGMLTKVLSPKYLQKYNARTLSVFHVNLNVSKQFLEFNHIQGYKNSSVRYGLYDGVYLVAYIGLSQRKDGWHIDRFATIGNVRGGFSKLLKHFQRNHEWSKIISFADRRYSQGNVYEICGFELESITKPGYDYTKGNIRYNRQRFMKHKLKNFMNNYQENLTEWQNANANGYYRIWNCGMLKYCLTKEA